MTTQIFKRLSIVTSAARGGNQSASGESQSPPPADTTQWTGVNPSPPLAKQTTLKQPTTLINIENQPITPDESDPFVQILETDNLIAEYPEEEQEIKLDRIPEDSAKKIVKSFAEKNQTTEHNALAGITKLVQDGGTNASKKELKRTINGTVFDIKDLRDAINYHYRGGTVRKLAKTLRKAITLIAVANSWPGPLVKDLQRLEPQLVLSPRDAVFCCEIHSDNYDLYIPAKIREALQRREQKVREQTKTKNPVKGKGKKR
jgi:hypothetical protein